MRLAPILIALTIILPTVTNQATASGASITILLAGRSRPYPDANPTILPIPTLPPNLTRNDLRDLPAPVPGNGLGVSFDGRFLYYTISGDNHIYNITTTGSLQGSIPVRFPNGTSLMPGAIAWDSLHKMFWIGSWDGNGVLARVSLEGIVSNFFSIRGLLKSLGELDTGHIIGLAYDPDTGTLWASSSKGKNILLVDPDTKTMLYSFSISPFLCSGIGYDGKSLWLALYSSSTDMTADLVPYSVDGEMLANVTLTYGLSGLVVDRSSFSAPAVWANDFESPNELRAINASLPPFPRFGWPRDGSVLYDNTVVLAGDVGLDEANDSIARFSFSSSGSAWTTFATDSSGLSVPQSPDFSGLVHGEWKGTLSIGSLAEGWYYLRVEMQDQSGNTGADVVRVYVDASPPLPTLSLTALSPGIYNVSATTSAADVANFTLYLKPTTTDFVKGVPIMDQLNTHYPINNDSYPFPNGGKEYCVPTAAASSLFWFAQHGYSALVSGTDVHGNSLSLTGTALIKALAKAMNTTAYGGTLIDSKVLGLQNWIGQHGGGFYVSHWYNPNFSDYKIEMEDFGEDVLWGTSGHVMTGNSVNDTQNQNGTYNVSFMNPWTSQIINVTMTSDGTITYTNGGYPTNYDLVTISPIDHPCSLCGTLTATTKTKTGGVWSLTWDTKGMQSGFYYLNGVIYDSKGHRGIQGLLIMATALTPPPSTPLSPNSLVYAALMVSVVLIVKRSATRRKLERMNPPSRMETRTPIKLDSSSVVH